MRLSRRQQLFQLARSGLGKLIDLLLRLEARLRRLVEEVRALRRQVKELKARLALNSTNSSKPPSSDGLTKPAPKSLRTKTGRRPGGQPGHPGLTLQPVVRPDHEIVHRLERCTCGACHSCSLDSEPVLDYERRQVFELPQKPLEVTEHQAEIKRCPVSGALVTAAFPPQVNAPAQYGPRFRAQMVYFNEDHFIPYTRLTRICQDLYGQPLSEATVAAANERTYENLAPFEHALWVLLPQAPVNHCDESGLRVASTLHWLHVVSNPHLTFYGVHPKRGREAMDYFDILPRCRNFLVHDHWKAYFTYEDCLHALCNQHHLRELKFLYEEQQEFWAQELSRFLLDLNQRRLTQGVLDRREFKKCLAAYHAILKKGRRRHPRQEGRAAQSKAANLLDRLEDFEMSVLAFAVFAEVPFTNNGGEQDIRMQKVQQKISGCFRTLHGARVSARIRSYISTCRKQGRNILDELEKAILGNPFIPSAPPAGP
jgi:transposase